MFAERGRGWGPREQNPLVFPDVCSSSSLPPRGSAACQSGGEQRCGPERPERISAFVPDTNAGSARSSPGS